MVALDAPERPTSPSTAGPRRLRRSRGLRIAAVCVGVAFVGAFAAQEVEAPLGLGNGGLFFAFSLVVIALVALVSVAAALLVCAVCRSQPASRTFLKDGVAAAGFLPPEDARLPLSRPALVVRAALLAALAAAVLAPTTWWLGVWGSYEHQLTVAVRDIGNCAGTSTNHEGWGGTLSARATDRFAAFCDELGPSVSWLRFRSAADMRQAMAADSTDRFPILANTTVCVNPSRAELVAFDDIDAWKVRFLCRRRGARIVRGPAD